MDLRIQITDENSRVIDRFVIYQDGSDSDGAAKIRSFVEKEFLLDLENKFIDIDYEFEFGFPYSENHEWSLT